MRRIVILAVGVLTLSMLAIAGVSAQDPTPEPTMTPFLGISFDNTAEQLVIQVMRRSPAYVAGLRDGDIITAVNGEAVTPQTIAEVIGAFAPGDVITISIERAGESLDVDVTLGARGTITITQLPNRPHDGRMPPPMMDTMPFAGGRGMFFSHNPQQGRLGVVYTPIDAQLAEENGLSVTEGALILEVEADSPAQEAGFLVDDVVIAVNDEPVDEERTLQDRMVAYEAGDVVSFTVLRGDETLTLVATLAERDMTMWFGRFGEMDMTEMMERFGRFGNWRELLPPIQMIPLPDAPPTQATPDV